MLLHALLPLPYATCHHAFGVVEEVSSLSLSPTNTTAFFLSCSFLSGTAGQRTGLRGWDHERVVARKRLKSMPGWTEKSREWAWQAGGWEGEGLCILLGGGLSTCPIHPTTLPQHLLPLPYSAHAFLLPVFYFPYSPLYTPHHPHLLPIYVPLLHHCFPPLQPYLYHSMYYIPHTHLQHSLPHVSHVPWPALACLLSCCI